MVIKRIATSLIGIPIIVMVLYGGRLVFLALITAIAAAGFMELARLLGKISAWPPVFSMVFAVIYLGAPLAFLLLIYGLKGGPGLIVYTLAATWLADTSAYLTGNLIGRRRLAPGISPNKTVEGAIGSMTITAAVFAVLTIVQVLTIAQRAVFGLIIAVAALCGDLFESWLKRQAGVKDSGSILPGHGGILDRIDSLLLVSPISYAMWRLWT